MHTHPAVVYGASTFPAPAGKRFLPPSAVAACKTFREAVRLAWEHRARPNMTQRSLAEECGLYAPHVSSYLHPEPPDNKKRPRLDLPADCIDAFEEAVGNHAIRQYLNHLGRLTIMEEVIAQRTA
ncbi:helix-turn-helix domain-containing protein [Achromobacter ruhlandii]|uniref:helix-turn-helix domain-containing protein n=1 Tax=Achromobacter ruhlandii TaxID=72557 RepID=UPI00201665C5|nr:XRE family transcriptional regulator [Achromobacter ruhlandii]